MNCALEMALEPEPPNPQTSLIITNSSFFPNLCQGDHRELRHYTTLTFCLFEELWSLQADIFYPRQLIALVCPLASSVQRLKRNFAAQDRVKREDVVQMESIRCQKKRKENIGEWGKEKKHRMRAKEKETEAGFVAWVLKAFLWGLSVWYYWHLALRNDTIVGKPLWIEDRCGTMQNTSQIFSKAA